MSVTLGRQHRKVQETVQEGDGVPDRLPAGAGRPARQQPGREIKREGGGGPERRRGKQVREGDGGKLDPVHERGHGLACGQDLF